MANSYGQKWLIILFFSAITLFLGYFLFFIGFNRTDKSYSTRLESARVGPGSYHQEENVHLIKDQPVTVGKIRMAYKGRTPEGFLLDLVLLELDPKYTYSRRIPWDEAENGFRVSHRKFFVTSISPDRLRLVMARTRP